MRSSSRRRTPRLADDEEDVDGEGEASQEEAADESGDEQQEKKKARGSKSRKPIPRKKDFAPDVQEVIEEAYLQIKAQLATSNIFPTATNLDAEAVAAFKRACKHLNKNFKWTGDIIRVASKALSFF